MNMGHIIVGKQNQILRRFRKAEATASERAQSLQDLGCRKSVVFRGLVRRGVLVETSGATGERYYLDSERADSFVATRRKILFVALMIVIAVVVAILLTP